jgi:ArsR family transcriptional regulator, arsenate/arsenite/antimonite-responsive transcriptional repressor
MKQSNLPNYFKALSNPQRFKLFMMIYMNHCDTIPDLGKPKCCGGMKKAFSKACACLNLSRSTISHHIKELVHSGLITCVREGQSQVCSINKDAVEELRNMLK